MKYKLQVQQSCGWQDSETYPQLFTAKKQAVDMASLAESRSFSGLKYRAVQYGVVPVVPSKPKSRLSIAKDFQKQIARLQREREKLFKQAMRTLKVPDSSAAWDYFMNDQQGASKFTEGL